MSGLTAGLRTVLGVVLVGLLAMLGGALPATANTSGTGLVISQVYGGGGNSGATYTHDFIEIFNPTNASVSLIGWSVHYGSTTGNIGPNSGQITTLSGSVSPGQYVLVQEAQGAGGTMALAPDITDDTPIAMSATGGKVALVNTTTGLNCGATATTPTPCGVAALGTVVDLVGYGAATLFEGAAPTAATANTTAALRNGGGCTDTDNNGADFTVSAPTPRNRLSSTHICPTG